MLKGLLDLQTHFPTSIVDSDMPKFKPLPEEGERKLCLLNGEWIVLEVHRESPTYEETFKEFLYWREPFEDMITPECWEVTTWVDLPEIPTDEQGDD